MLKNLFISEVRIKILKLMLLNPEKSFHVRAIVRQVGAEINAVRRELDNLVELNLLKRRQSSNRIYYTVNTSHPLFSELLSMVAKEDAIGSHIIKKAKELGDVSFAVISLGFLRGRASTALDVDLFIVGEVNVPVLEKIVKEEESKRGKEINFTVMPAEEFKYRKRTNDQFVIKVLSQSRSMLIGDEEKFCSVM
jgi:hypothetical protein